MPILFGDGVGAAIIGHVDSGGIHGFDQGADGHSSDILKCVLNQNIVGFNNVSRPGLSPMIDMDGKAVFKKGVEIVVVRSIETFW